MLNALSVSRSITFPMPPSKISVATACGPPTTPSPDTCRWSFVSRSSAPSGASNRLAQVHGHSSPGMGHDSTRLPRTASTARRHGFLFPTGYSFLWAPRIREDARVAAKIEGLVNRRRRTLLPLTATHSFLRAPSGLCLVCLAILLPWRKHQWISGPSSAGGGFSFLAAEYKGEVG